MKISYLAATTLVLGLTTLGTTASASCSNLGCSPHSGTSTGYGHTSTGYNSGHSTYSHGNTNTGHSYTGATHSGVTANCPAGTSPSSDGSCLINGNGSSYFGSSSSHNSHRAHNARRSHGQPSYGTSHGTHSSHNGHSNHGASSGRHYTGTLRNYRSSTGSAVAPLGSYAGQTRHTTGYTSGGHMSGAQATRRYGSGSVSRSYSNNNHTIVPFSTNATNISTHRIAGMGDNEVLTPTQCPVSVYNPNGGQVMGCYSVGTVAPRRTTTVSRTVTRRIIPHRVRVVRPIIYVRYPVPVPVPFPVYQTRPQMGYGYAGGGCNAGYATRYGQSWPGRPCGY